MKTIELFNDHFQNYKVYGIPKAQLIIADVPTILETTLTPPILLGMSMAITRMAKAIWLAKSSLIQIKTLDPQSLCTSVAKC